MRLTDNDCLAGAFSSTASASGQVSAARANAARQPAPQPSGISEMAQAVKYIWQGWNRWCVTAFWYFWYGTGSQVCLARMERMIHTKRKNCTCFSKPTRLIACATDRKWLPGYTCIWSRPSMTKWITPNGVVSHNSLYMAGTVTTRVSIKCSVMVTYLISNSALFQAVMKWLQIPTSSATDSVQVDIARDSCVCNVCEST